jgi:hypothetical protein
MTLKLNHLILVNRSRSLSAVCDYIVLEEEIR